MENSKDHKAAAEPPLDCRVSGLTDFQRRFISKLERCRNTAESTTILAAKLNTSRAAVVSAGRALERKGLVCSFRSDSSEWAALKWGLTHRPANADVIGLAPKGD